MGKAHKIYHPNRVATEPGSPRGLTVGHLASKLVYFTLTTDIQIRPIYFGSAWKSPQFKSTVGRGVLTKLGDI